jgi:hypothetical protein
VKTVFIIDSNYPKDHYLERADGSIAQQILKALNITADLRLALDRECFERAVSRASKKGCDVLHISCHGDDNGIGLCSDDPRSRGPMGLSWDELTALFQDNGRAPTALVMSACCGAATGLGKAFGGVSNRPKIIIGSTDPRPPADYVAAWGLLYRRFKRSGIHRDVAQAALRDICAVVHKHFRYLRWDENSDSYRHFPRVGTEYEVSEVET